jgi:hypothetical protein
VVICGLIMIFDLVAAVRGFDLHQIHAEIIDRRHRLFVAPRQIAVMQKNGVFCRIYGVVHVARSLI